MGTARVFWRLIKKERLPAVPKHPIPPSGVFSR